MILYRDISRPASPRWPSWLEGAENLCRRGSDKGDMIAITDPMVFPPAEGLKWRDIDDGWQVAQVGAPDVPQLIRSRTDCGTLTVADGRGALWLVPAVLDPEGGVAMATPLACVGGKWGRQPTVEQAAIIDAAQAARVEILANRLHLVPVDAACSWVCILLAAVYHLNPDAIGALGLLDDLMIPRVLLAAAGFPPPEA